MRKYFPLLVALFFFGNQTANAQTLVAGDIAFIGVNEDAGPTAGHDHSFTWIALTAIPAGEIIYFTDEGVNSNGAGSWIGNAEGHYRWTSPSPAGLACGTIVYTYENGAASEVLIPTHGSFSAILSGSAWNLSSGDQVLAYYAPAAESSMANTTFISGIHMNDDVSSGYFPEVNGWTSTSYAGTAVAASMLPPGLTNGVNCNSLHGNGTNENDNVKYTGTLVGSSSDLRALINSHFSAGNWYGDNGIDATVSIQPGAYSPSVTCVATAGNWDGSTSTDWNTANNWAGNVVPTSADNITIPSAPSNQPNVTSNPGTPAVCNDIIIESGATLTVNAGKALTISGTTANAGTIVVEADATGIGSLITTGAVSGAGSFQMEQYLTGSGGATPNGVFYYVSSPIPNATAASYNIAGGNKLWIDDEPSQAYPELTFGAIPLAVTQGYIARMGATGAITFTGSSYNTGNLSASSLTRTGTSELNRGYNLVGNPYPSTISWDNATRTNLETTMWYRTKNGTNMLFDTYNATGMVGTDNNGTTVTGDIAPTQAFWVRVSADGLTGQVDFENTDRTHGTLSGIYKVAAEEGNIRIALSNGTVSDQQIILFNPLAQGDYDDYDSQKFWSNNVPQLYSTLTEDTLTINGLNNPFSTPTVALGMKLPATNNYTLNATSITLTETPVYLEDTYLSVFQDLNANPVYAFTSDAGNIGDRFVLHFSVVTKLDEKENKINIYTSENSINIVLSELRTGQISVLDMTGRIVYHQSINSNQTVINLKNAAGVYVVSVRTDKKTITRKIAIQ